MTAKQINITIYILVAIVGILILYNALFVEELNKKRVISLEEVVCASAICVNKNGVQKCIEFSATPVHVIFTRDPMAEKRSDRVIINVPTDKICK